MILNTPQNPQWTSSRSTTWIFCQVPWLEHHQKSVGRPKKSSACKMAQEPHRTRSLLLTRMCKRIEKRLQAVILPKGVLLSTDCRVPTLLPRALLLFFVILKTVKDGNKNVFLLKMLKKCVVFNRMPFGNRVIWWSDDFGNQVNENRAHLRFIESVCT